MQTVRECKSVGQVEIIVPKMRTTRVKTKVISNTINLWPEHDLYVIATRLIDVFNRYGSMFSGYNFKFI